MIRHTLVALAGVAGLLACAAPREPAKQIGAAETAVKSAEQERAAPEAAGLELTMAREKLERAKTAMRDKDYDKAERLAEEAAADAELGRVKAQTDSAQKSADELSNAIQSLRGEAQRGADHVE
jgi:uncharacterized protein DUF4398